MVAENGSGGSASAAGWAGEKSREFPLTVPGPGVLTAQGTEAHQEVPIMDDIVTVSFRGDTLYGFRADDGVFIALKPIVEGMGLDWSAQFRRVKRDPILSEGIATMATPFGRGGAQEAICLKEDLIQGWLFTIDSTRIRNDEVRERVILYQRECYGVLHDHFRGKARGRGAPEVEGAH